MKMSLFIERLSSDLQALGKLGGIEMAETVSRLLPTLEPVLRTRLLEALGEVATELKTQMPGHSFEARVNGDEVSLISAQEEVPNRDTPGDLSARITLRLPEELKSRIEAAAGREGISLNSWLLKASERGSFQINTSGRQIKGKGRS
jgi:hypothetical protein